jgi:hypothetical protein
MGQSISVAAKPMDGFCVFTTDRVLTGQDGVRFESVQEADAETGFPALLASRLFAGDEAVVNVWVAASEVVVGRTGGWDEATTAQAQQIITDLYRFYN